jgi:hypothetical protein
MTYDSSADTYTHICRVRELLTSVSQALVARGAAHDASKLESPEKETFDAYTPLLRTLEYGSSDYREALTAMGTALQHHYAQNAHHPEHYPDGVAGMSLLDLVEMMADWKAASERHTGDFRASLAISAARFDIGPQLLAILENTAREFGWIT